MKNEDAFNAYLSKEMKRFIPYIHVLRSVDKINVGIPDFIIWARCTSVGIESKFITKEPARQTTKLLKHAFQGPQQTFLNSMYQTGNHGWGIVGHKDKRLIYLFKQEHIPKSGNWTKGEWEAFTKTEACKIFTFNDVEEILDFVFGGSFYDK